MIHITGIPITGESVKPAPSIGPALVVGGAILTQIWLFIVVQIIGAVLAAFAGKYLLE